MTTIRAMEMRTVEHVEATYHAGCDGFVTRIAQSYYDDREGHRLQAWWKGQCQTCHVYVERHLIGLELCTIHGWDCPDGPRFTVTEEVGP